MRRTLIAAFILISFLAIPRAAEARGRAWGYCGTGNVFPTITGLGTATQAFQQSAPSCTVTVYLAGTITLATIYSDDSGTSKANPFTAAAAGYWFWYADQGRYDIKLSGGGLASPVTLGDYQLIDAANVTASATAVPWSGLTAPTGSLGLSMSTNLSTFTWGNLSGLNNALALTDGATSSSVGSLLALQTGAGSTMKPFTATAQGASNGVQLSLAGLLTAIGTGGIRATDLSCTACVTNSEIQSITDISKLPATIAYLNATNVFTLANTFNSTVSIKGGTAFKLILTGTPSADRTITIPDATDTLVNLASAQTLSSKTFSDTLVFKAGTAFKGILTHANSVDRTYTFPNATGTVLLAPSLTSGSVITTDGTTLTQDNATFFWSTSNKRLGIGNNAPSASLHVQPKATASEVAMIVQGNSTANADVLDIKDSAGSPVKQSYFDSTAAFLTAKAITSTLTTGTAPFTVSSTTPVANLTTVPVTYNHSGTQQTATHIVRDSCAIGSTCAVTLTGSAVFSSSSSYTCVAEDGTAVAATKIVQSSGSAFTITGTGTDSVLYLCVGN